MGLTGAPATYSMLKDLVMGPIPEPFAELDLASAMGADATMDHFIDDNMGGGRTFDLLFTFLHEWYFLKDCLGKINVEPQEERLLYGY